MSSMTVKKKASVALAATGTAVVACGVCCALPFLVPVALLVSGGAVLAWFSEASNVVMAASVAAIGAGWIWTGVQSWRSGRRPARATLWVLSLATAIGAAALLWTLW
ncbi:MAG: hypothetical protein ABS35_26410 [Kaistia sp. SCN 65-12]|nr:MAG: hypothetical protein ABS35_26410 [Kaistia sp. SCN 65-12]